MTGKKYPPPLELDDLTTKYIFFKLLDLYKNIDFMKATLQKPGGNISDNNFFCSPEIKMLAARETGISFDAIFHGNGRYYFPQGNK